MRFHAEAQLVLIIVAVARLDNYPPDTFRMLPIDPQHLNRYHKRRCKRFFPFFIRHRIEIESLHFWPVNTTKTIFSDDYLVKRFGHYSTITQTLAAS